MSQGCCENAGWLPCGSLGPEAGEAGRTPFTANSSLDSIQVLGFEKSVSLEWCGGVGIGGVTGWTGQSL